MKKLQNLLTVMNDINKLIKEDKLFILFLVLDNKLKENSNNYKEF